MLFLSVNICLDASASRLYGGSIDLACRVTFPIQPKPATSNEMVTNHIRLCSLPNLEPSQSICCLFQPNLTPDLTKSITESMPYSRTWQPLITNCAKVDQSKNLQNEREQKFAYFPKKVQIDNLQIFNNIIFIYNIIFILWFETNICKSCTKTRPNSRA